jgi:hypothetical protein
MRNILLTIILSVLCTQFLYTEDNTQSRVFALSKTKFAVLDENENENVVDLTGQDFIVASLREKDADGLAYAIDKDGVVW